MENPIKPADPVNPPAIQNPLTHLNKPILISIIVAVIIAGGFLFFSSGNQYQGLIKTNPAQELTL